MIRLSNFLLAIATMAAISIGSPRILSAQKTNSIAATTKTVEVKTFSDIWYDGERDREIPYKIYYPEKQDGPLPLVIFSHGLGGSREGASYLGNYWASHGYIALYLQHHGSDEALWKNSKTPIRSLKASLRNPNNALDRPKDVTFAIDQMEIMNSENELFKGKLDLDKIGMSGHSFGAFTALASSGRVFQSKLFPELDLSDKRIKACIAFSAPAKDLETDRGIYYKFKTPCLHMTGTEDDSPINDMPAEYRRVPYDAIQCGDQYLVTFEGGDHMVFSGHRTYGSSENTGRGNGRLRNLLGGNNQAAEREKLFLPLIQESTTLFWDAYLKDDKAALASLKSNGLEAMMRDEAQVEKK